MKTTKFYKITVTGTKQACDDHFKLMKSACDVEMEEFKIVDVSFQTIVEKTKPKMWRWKSLRL